MLGQSSQIRKSSKTKLRLNHIRFLQQHLNRHKVYYFQYYTWSLMLILTDYFDHTLIRNTSSEGTQSLTSYSADDTQRLQFTHSRQIKTIIIFTKIKQHY
jgi:hypothetical protein